MENQKVKTLVLTVKTQNLCAFMSVIENNLTIFKYILKQKQMLQNLLVSFENTRGVPVNRL